jgi:hypothetical protein
LGEKGTKEMKDIELRFVERDWRDQLDTYTAIVRKIKVLQYRKLTLCGFQTDGWKSWQWSDWQDVPLEVEEE